MNSELEIIRTAQSMVLESSMFVGIAVFAARWLIFAFAGVAASYWARKREAARHAVIESLWAGALALSATAVIAALVGRERPFMVADGGVLLLIPPPFNLSFPSGHTATAFALAAAFAFGSDGRTWPLFVLAAAVAFGRLLVGVHYPTDLFGGAVLGIACAALVRVLHRSIRRKDIERSAQSHHHV